MTSRAFRIAALAAISGAAVGCAAGSQIVVRPPTSRLPPASALPSPSKAVVINPRVVAKPAERLRDGQAVTVTATGFSPNQALLALECADKGNKTSQGDCNLSDLVSLSTDSSGTGTARVTVHTGAIGSNMDPCDRSHPCLISVSQATLDPSESATAIVTFR